MGLYRDNGKENGDYCVLIGYILGLTGDSGQRWPSGRYAGRAEPAGIRKATLTCLAVGSMLNPI